MSNQAAGPGPDTGPTRLGEFCASSAWHYFPLCGAVPGHRLHRWPKPEPVGRLHAESARHNPALRTLTGGPKPAATATQVSGWWPRQRWRGVAGRRPPQTHPIAGGRLVACRRSVRGRRQRRRAERQSPALLTCSSRGRGLEEDRVAALEERTGSGDGGAPEEDGVASLPQICAGERRWRAATDSLA
jgi:hypothetical protein